MVAALIREEHFIGLLIVLFFKSYWLSICLMVESSRKVQWCCLLTEQQPAGSFCKGSITEGIQLVPIEQTEVSPHPKALSNRLTAIFSPSRYSSGLIQQPIAKCLPTPHIPKQLNYFWKLNDTLGRRAYSTARHSVQQGLLWPSQPADPLNTIAPCLLGKRHLKPHSRFVC